MHLHHHLLKEVRAIEEHCTLEEKNVLEPMINWNGFYAHPEIFQLPLLCSENFNDRLLGIDTILKI